MNQLRDGRDGAIEVKRRKREVGQLEDGEAATDRDEKGAGVSDS